MIFEEYLRGLERGQTDRQTECINTFQLCWKVLKKEHTKQLKQITSSTHI